jgi:hypothetical protein
MRRIADKLAAALHRIYWLTVAMKLGVERRR